MKLSYKTRRRLSVVVLLVWLPAYIIMVLPLLLRVPADMNIILKTVIFVVAAFIWVLPFKFVFLGVGRADPDAPENND